MKRIAGIILGISILFFAFQNCSDVGFQKKPVPQVQTSVEEEEEVEPIIFENPPPPVIVETGEEIVEEEVPLIEKTLSGNLQVVNKMGGISQNQCGGQSDTMDIAALVADGMEELEFFMVCVSSGCGARYSQVQFWLEDAAGNKIYESDIIHCTGQAVGSHSIRGMHDMQWESLPLPPEAVALKTQGQGCNGNCANNYSVGAYFYLRSTYMGIAGSTVTP